MQKSQVHSVEVNLFEEFFHRCTGISKPDERDWIVPMTVNGTIISLKLDTGAQVNILSEQDYETLKIRPKLEPTKIKVTDYS